MKTTKQNRWRNGLSLGIGILTLATTLAAQGTEPVTNEDVKKMVQARLASTIVANAITSAPIVKFDLSPDSLITLKNAGVSDFVIQAMISKEAAQQNAPNVNAPEKSERLATSKDKDFILRNFKTMWIDANGAEFFKTPQMKAALGEDKNFQSLGIVLVADQRVADVILEVSYTFAWDYPFTLKHQNSSIVLLSGKGTGPFSAPLGAQSVAEQLAKMLKGYRANPAVAKNQ
jgi:hypothetical protein